MLVWPRIRLSLIPMACCTDRIDVLQMWCENSQYLSRGQILSSSQVRITIVALTSPTRSQKRPGRRNKMHLEPLFYSVIPEGSERYPDQILGHPPRNIQFRETWKSSDPYPTIVFAAIVQTRPFPPQECRPLLIEYSENGWVRRLG